MSEIFKDIPEIKYEGKDSKNPFAFKYYDAEKVITISNITGKFSEKIETTAVGKLMDAGLVKLDESIINKLDVIQNNTAIPAFNDKPWRECTVDEVLDQILDLIPSV